MVIVPEPVPDCGGPTVTHGTCDVAVQLQPASVVTATDREPPCASSDSVVDPREKRHADGDCSTRACSPLITIAPVRGVAAGFAETRNVTCPDPWPVVG